MDGMINKAKLLADKRERLLKHRVCPECQSNQVQLIGWPNAPGWRCRECKYKWRSE